MTAGLIWSIVLSVIGIAGIFIAGRKHWLGWAIGLGAQVLWIVFALTTAQYGFILSALGYGTVYGLNTWRWLADRRRRREVAEA